MAIKIEMVNNYKFLFIIAADLIFMAKNIKPKVGQFHQDESISNLSKFVCSLSVKTISWLKSLSSVEFDITSEDGSHSSSIWVTRTETEVRGKTLLMRKHDGMDFPLFCCESPVKTVSRGRAACPPSANREETPFSVFHETSRTHLFECCESQQCVEPLTTAGNFLEREGGGQKRRLDE